MEPREYLCWGGEVLDRFYVLVILIFVLSSLACVIIFSLLFKIRREALLMSEGADKNYFVVSRISKYFGRLGLILILVYAMIWALVLQLNGARFPIQAIVPFVAGIFLVMQSSWKVVVHQNEIYQKSLFRPKKVLTFYDIKRIEVRPQNEIVLYAETGKLFSIKQSYLNYNAFVDRLKERNVAGAERLAINHPPNQQ